MHLLGFVPADLAKFKVYILKEINVKGGQILRVHRSNTIVVPFCF